MKEIVRFAKIQIILTLAFLFFDGLDKMYFHQDDIILFWDVVTRFPRTLFENYGHLLAFFKLLYRLEWQFFHLNYAGYLAVSVILHALVISTAGAVVFHLTRDKFWRLVCVLALVVNPNWFEVLWMSSGSTIELMVLSSLLCYLFVLKRLGRLGSDLIGFILIVITAIIPGLNWGSGLPIAFWLLVAYGWEIKAGKLKLTSVFFPLLLGQVIIAATYLSTLNPNFGGTISPSPWWANLFEKLRFTVFAVSYSVISRYFFPFANRLGRQLAFVHVIYWLFLPRHLTLLFRALNKNLRPILLGAVVAIGSYFLIAIPRWHFGLGQAAAPHYAYLPVIFVTIAVVSSFGKLGLGEKRKKAVLLGVMAFSLLSLGGFAQVTVNWVERPQKNRLLFRYLQNLDHDSCLKNTLLPWYIVEVDTWTLKDIWPIFNKDFDPFRESDNCVEIKRDVAQPWSVI